MMTVSRPDTVATAAELIQKLHRDNDNKAVNEVSLLLHILHNKLLFQPRP